MTLTDHLDRCYAARIGVRHPALAAQMDDPFAAFTTALVSDEDLRDQAGRRRDALVDDVTRRCFISQSHRQILDAAINAALARANARGN